MAGSTSETPVLDLLASMTADSLEASSLDPETLVLVRIAALVAVGAPPVSYLLNLGAAATSASTPSRSAVSSPRSPRSSAQPGSQPRPATSSRRSRSRSRSRTTRRRTRSSRLCPDGQPPRCAEGQLTRPVPCTRVALIEWRDEISAARTGGSGSSSASPSGSHIAFWRPASPPGRSTGHLTLRPERRSSAGASSLARTVA